MTTDPEQSVLPSAQGSRVILYHQTHHLPNDGGYVSLLPLITNSTGISHVVIAAFHLNEPPGHITLNDDPPEHEKNNTLWGEVAWLQASGVKILAMLGGAAKGSFAKLDGDDSQRFESYYVPFRDVIRRHRLDGVDLDVEENMSQSGIVRLIDRLRADFGSAFLITLAPVATALLPSQPHLSGFDYRLLEQMRGYEIAWYNTQFYCGWGDAGTTYWYDAIMSVGWPAQKVVMGLITNPQLGPGHIAQTQMEIVLRDLRMKYPGFGGVMGWEYFNALPGGQERPWEWATNMSSALRTALPPRNQQAGLPMRPYGATLSSPPHTFPAASVQSLRDLGFNQVQAVAALNMTNGNVEQAAGLLFED